MPRPRIGNNLPPVHHIRCNTRLGKGPCNCEEIAEKDFLKPIKPTTT